MPVASSKHGFNFDDDFEFKVQELAIDISDGLIETNKQMLN